MEDEFAEDNQVSLEPCQICGRNFNSKTLIKHQEICAKVTLKKRKVFDSTKQRAEALDLSVHQIKQALKRNVPVPKSNWKAKHQDFVNSIRNAKKVSQAVAEGKPLPPPPPPTINTDYVQCEYCERRFNKYAAERHITFCKEQHQRILRKPAAKPKAKPQYEIPKLRNRTEPSPVHSMPNLTSTYSSPTKIGNVKPQQERSGLHRPGFMSRLPSAPASQLNNKKITKDVYRQGTDEHDAGTNNGVSYAAMGPALRPGRSGKAYTDAIRDAKTSAGANRMTGGLSMVRAASGNRTIPNSFNRTTSGNRYMMTKGIENNYHTNNNSNHSLKKSCHNCDTRYPIAEAKYCCECGMKRLLIR